MTKTFEQLAKGRWLHMSRKEYLQTYFLFTSHDLSRKPWFCTYSAQLRSVPPVGKLPCHRGSSVTVLPSIQTHWPSSAMSVIPTNTFSSAARMVSRKSSSSKSSIKINTAPSLIQLELAWLKLVSSSEILKQNLLYVYQPGFQLRAENSTRQN